MTASLRGLVITHGLVIAKFKGLVITHALVRAKWFTRENCGFNFEALKAILPEALASVSSASTRGFYRLALRALDAYSVSRRKMQSQCSTRNAMQRINNHSAAPAMRCNATYRSRHVTRR